MTNLPDPSTRHLRSLVTARSLADGRGVPAESVDFEEAASGRPESAAVTGRVEDALASALDRIPPDEVGDPRDFRRALEILLRETQRTTRKLDENPGASLTQGDAMALEAVIRTDGSRPTLLVRNDAADPRHPLAGDWSGILEASRDALRDRVRAVGRVKRRTRPPAASSAPGGSWTPPRASS